jgi:hypothetical protein
MAFTKDDIDSIDSAIASGELTVDFGDRKITYRSITDLKKAKAHILENMSQEELLSIGVSRNRRRKPRAFRMSVGKGV